MKQISPFR